MRSGHPVYTCEEIRTHVHVHIYICTTKLYVAGRLRSDAARLINDSYNISLSRAPRLARYLTAEATKKPANINIYFMFYICFSAAPYACMCVRRPTRICIRLYIRVTWWRVFHEMDDANAMTLRIPGDERSFRLEQSERIWPGELWTSLIGTI